MRSTPDSLTLSASDLGKFLICRHSTALDLAVATGLRAKPPKYHDPVLELLIARGFEHEQRFVDEQRGKSVTVVDLKDGEDRVARTIEAMKQGADLIVQGQVEHEAWGGYPDVLRRIETASPNLGGWSYEVIDTKLTKETKGTTILQLALYSEIVGIIQGMTPEFFHVVTPDKPESYRFNDYAAYYRLVKRGLAEAVTCDPGQLAAANYPEPVDHCELCRWEMDCKKKRRADDHLSLVAGISRLQRRELEPRGVTTLEALGTMPLPLTPKPERGSPATYERVREQARVQLEGRQRNANIHELLRVKVGEGLTRLPEPSPGDIFLDLEGEPFSRDGGREYLFGIITADATGKLTYEKHWAFTDHDECAAFETVMDGIMTAWGKHAGMHVYHYAPYEPSAFKRLMGRYATRESDVDRLLRGGRFIDLYGVVKQSVRASVERYSIKDLEKFYGFNREMNDLRKAGDHRALVDRCLQTDSVAAITDEDRTIVETYNKDDCVSTLRLRDWLEELRAGLIGAGTEVPRPMLKAGEPPEELTEHQQRIRALMDELIKEVPADHSARSPEQQARWILAQLLEYHRREDKVAWWEFFRLAELPLEEYEDEPRAIIGLAFVERLDPGKRNTPLDRYTYPDQECYIHDDDLLHDADGELGTVMDQDRAARTIDVKKRQTRANDHPSAVFAHRIVRARPLPEALERIGRAVVDGGLVDAGTFRAAWSLLTGEGPRLRSTTFARRQGESAPDFAVRIVTDLDGTVLPIQGPPGSGKTCTGAQMICELVQKGKRVGVTGPSHKVIENLLCKVVSEAKDSKRALVCGAKVGQESEAPGAIREFTDNGDALDALRTEEIHVLGGTPWLWAHEDALGSVDVLVCDEAGQMSLTNVVAASGAADSIVLLGDPQQLEQVQQGSHPDGTDVSALEHILGVHRTMPDDCGIFLPETWRMHPDICAFCSDVFYESRLGPRAGLEKQALTGVKRFEGAGLWVVHVDHEGNQNDSPEEVDAVEDIVNELLGKGARWTDEKGKENPMTPDEILVVAPYNRHVTRLYERLSPRGVKVGTVDKFQGREAAVVIYSMASSSPSDASRGMEFLYSLSRLNVATSRARCATILVASPKLFEPECKSPRQMKLANALCRYVEMARPVLL